MHLSGTGTFRPVSDVVFVVVAPASRSASGWSRRSLRARWPGDPLPVPPARDRRPRHPADGLDRAYDGLAGFEARFPVPAFSVFAQETGGVWVPRKDFALGGS
jgi:hypothetical protein